MAPEKPLSQYPRPKSLFGLRAAAPLDLGEGDTCAYCGAAIAPSAAQPGACSCGAQNSGVSARERRQQQMAG